MPFANVAGSYKLARPGPRGVINQGRGFNHFPQIIAAFPNALSAIVAETADDLGILAVMLAPVIVNQRNGDPAPGNLKASEKTKIFYRSAGDRVVTGRVEFTAKDPRGHRYAKPLETGSLRRTKRGLIRVKERPFLVDAIMRMRPVFIERLQGLEARLPR